MPCHLAGPTCDSQDTIRENVMLPADIRVGDRIAFLQTGAYTRVYAANAFNGFSAPHVVVTTGQPEEK